MMAQDTAYNHPSIFHVLEGAIHYKAVSKDFLKSIKELPVKMDDVFVTSFPKSGTTWVSEILSQIDNNGVVNDNYIENRVPHLLRLPHYNDNINSREALHSFYLNHSPRLFQAHLQYHQVPMGEGKTTKPKYIYVARNPKDVAVSFYYYYKNLSRYEFGEKCWDDFFHLFINDKVHYGSWFDHVLGWWPHRDDSNVLFLKYEDIYKDHPGTVQKISKFICKDISSKIIQQIAYQTTFQTMSKEVGKYLAKNWMTPSDPNAKFIRKGQIGDWKNHFTEKQNEIFDEIYEKKMAGSGLDFEFSSS